VKDLKHIKSFNEATENLNISDVSSRAYRIGKAREIYENISSLYDTFDTVGNDDLQEAKTLITNYIMKLQQC
jgi:hypothetical protein